MTHDDAILLGHGSGGKLTRDLIGDVLVPPSPNAFLAPLADAAYLQSQGVTIAFTTDSFVVKPVVFPGGDIGKLAACGTLNDLAVMGARPLYLSCALILEEGFPLEELKALVRSLHSAAEGDGACVVTGDTKVVERGSADRIFINTSGIGILEAPVPYSADRIAAGDAVIVSGTMGDHGTAILSARENLGLSDVPPSDCASLAGMLLPLARRCDGIRFMRDPTRGGLATVLNEVVQGRPFGIKLDEKAIPVKPQVDAVCELLGLDPLYLANEGKVVIIVSPSQAQDVLEGLRAHSLGRDAAIIGTVVPSPQGKVFMKTGIKGTRIVDMMIADQLPRIC
jgi:hydrogenase expression/formation protein HypE